MLERLLGIVFCAIVLLNFAGAAARYLGGRAFVGADELQVYTMVWLLFIGAGLAAVRKALRDTKVETVSGAHTVQGDPAQIARLLGAEELQIEIGTRMIEGK